MADAAPHSGVSGHDPELSIRGTLVPYPFAVVHANLLVSWTRRQEAAYAEAESTLHQDL